MDPTIDERRFRELQDESDDLHSDAVQAARADLNAYVDAATRARASSKDVMALQTAAGLENLAVLTYQTAVRLPFIGGSSANRVVTSFVQKTMAQHTDHAKAFNAAVTKLGGKPQGGTDPNYTPIVHATVRTMKRVEDVVRLAIMLEDVGAQTFSRDVSLVSTSDLRTLFAGVAGVEAQHRAILLAMQSLLTVSPSLIARPPDTTELPGAVGRIGFPASFYPTALAAPVGQGVVK